LFACIQPAAPHIHIWVGIPLTDQVMISLDIDDSGSEDETSIIMDWANNIRRKFMPRFINSGPLLYPTPPRHDFPVPQSPKDPQLDNLNSVPLPDFPVPQSPKDPQLNNLNEASERVKLTQSQSKLLVSQICEAESNGLIMRASLQLNMLAKHCLNCGDTSLLQEVFDMNQNNTVYGLNKSVRAFQQVINKDLPPRLCFINEPTLSIEQIINTFKELKDPLPEERNILNAWKILQGSS